MLPTNESKLLAKWQGPFEVIKKLSSTTYQISTPGRGRFTRNLHVNLLKEWVPRPMQSCSQAVLLIRNVEDEEVEEPYLPKSPSMVCEDSALDLQHLSPDRQAQVRALCELDVVQENPGRTTVVEHEVVLTKDASVRCMSYRIPERLLVFLKK